MNILKITIKSYFFLYWLKSIWQNSYGTHIKNDETRELLELPKKAILIGFPSQMGITDDLNESLNNVMENIDIDKYVKIKKL